VLHTELNSSTACVVLLFFIPGRLCSALVSELESVITMYIMFLTHLTLRVLEFPPKAVA